MMNDTAAVAGSNGRPYPHFLERVEQSLGDVELTCWYDYEPADPSTGFNATAWLVRAHVRDSPHDISGLLRDTAVRELEADAAEYLSGG